MLYLYYNLFNNKTMTKSDKNKFYRCQGNCGICFNEGDCSLEKDIKKKGIEKVSKIAYNK